MATLASTIHFSSLCSVLEQIIKVRGAKKTELLRNYFKNYRQLGINLKQTNPNADVSAYPILRVFLLKNDREREAYGLKQKMLGDLYINAFLLGKGSEEARRIKHYKEEDANPWKVNDFAECIFKILEPKLGSNSTVTVEDVNRFLDDLADKNSKNENKKPVLINFMQKCNSLEVKWLTRMILKDLKLGLGVKTVLDAYHPDADWYFGQKTNIREVCDALIDERKRLDRNVFTISVLSPFKPMLLERCKIEEISKFFIEDHKEYIVQTKYDGERSQLHMKDGQFKYYSRHGLDITKNPGYGDSKDSGGFLTPKILNLLNPSCHSIILDGELMGWHKQRREFGSKGMEYDVKKLTCRSHFQPCFMAFDIIMYNDELLLKKPLRERLRILDNAIEEEEGVLMKSKNQNVNSTEELLKIFNQSIDNKEEGIVVKKSNSIYKPNVREGSNCFKLKAEYSEGLINDLDMLIVGGYLGDGRFSGMIKSFLMAVLDKNPQPVFYSAVGVGTGLTDDEMRQLNERFKPFWVKQCPDNVMPPKKFSPHVWIDPEQSLILQLRATEIIKCVVYPTDFTLRFPRIVKIREDKPWLDACTLREFRSLIGSNGIVHKLTKRHATSRDIQHSALVKLPKSPRKPREKVDQRSKIDARFFGVDPSEVSRISRLFHNKEICIVNGEPMKHGEDNSKKLTKPDMERIVLMHSGTITQNPRSETFCAVVGDPKIVQSQRLLQMNSKNPRHDFVKAEWLKRATQPDAWEAVQDYYPWEILSSTMETALRIREQFDLYYDSYTTEATLESLKRSLKKFDSVKKNLEIADDEIQQMKRELFGEDPSPLALFINVKGFFTDPSDENKHEFLFSNGNISDELTDSITHIFVGDNCDLSDLYQVISDLDSSPDIVRSQWISDCFLRRELLPVNGYTASI